MVVENSLDAISYFVENALDAISYLVEPTTEALLGLVTAGFVASATLPGACVFVCGNSTRGLREFGVGALRRRLRLPGVSVHSSCPRANFYGR